MKKRRRRGLTDRDAANVFLETEYWADHNARFAQAPASTDDFHVARQSGHAPARSPVVVWEGVDGRVEIRYRDRVMRWTEIVAGMETPGAAPRTVAVVAAAPSAPLRTRAAAADHPWRQGFKQMGRDVPYWQLVK